MHRARPSLLLLIHIKFLSPSAPSSPKVPRATAAGRAHVMIPDRSHLSSHSSHRRRVLHVLEHQLEAVAQISHHRIWSPLQLESLRNHPHTPVHQLGILASLEDKVELSRSLPIQTELVHGSLGVGISVGGKPFLCTIVSHSMVSGGKDFVTYPRRPWTCSGTSHGCTSHRPCEPWP
jgi:hypothetical protein